ncbi:MAG: MBL fold metallo-hydrolase [Clostridiales Family XIII bacterium]|jgi:metallo-beta-lactamase family protein|nr:MBL fold metallo-hydrolase [Clostridiales Family XIII bacterium]
MKITFCGAAESVTGSCHLLDIKGKQPGDTAAKLLLDCGQFQGSSKQEAQNFEPFPFAPGEIDFVILSHAHVDHCGRLPLLVRDGFKGRIYCTDSTADLLGIMLRDSAHIHQNEAEWKNKKAARAGKPAVEPLFTMNDAEETLGFVSPISYDVQFEPVPGVKAVFNEAGHILGSAIIELWFTEGGETKKLVFSGDLGVEDRPLLNDPTYIKKADYVIMETTYGNRAHEEKTASAGELVSIINRTIRRGGNVVIPSFAVGRTQDLIYELNEYYEHGDDPDFNRIMVYVDSPMARAATKVFEENFQDLDEATKGRILHGDNPLDFANLIFTASTEESKGLNTDMVPKAIISASGMCEAGRVRHHLKHNLWNPKSSIVFVGYQAENTLGRKIIEGARSVILFGEEIYVNAEVYNLHGFSAHADRDGLLKWVKAFTKKPEALFLVHGELEAKKDFASLVKEATGISATVVEDICEVDLSEIADGLLQAEALSSVAPGKAAYSQDGAGETAKEKPSSPGFDPYGKPAAPVTEIDPEDLPRFKQRISDVGGNLENLLYEAKLSAIKAVGDNDSEKFAALNNLAIQLENATIRLATELTGKKL